MQIKPRPIRPRRAPLVAAPPGYGIPARDLTQETALAWLDENGSTVGEVKDGKVTLAGELDGVLLEYCGAQGCHAQAQSHLDPRFAVYLVRLARMLREKFGALAIRHYGMWPAGKGQVSHDNGIAIDLAGVVLPDGYVSVLSHWGNKPRTTSGYRLQPGDRGYDLFRAIYAFTSSQGDDRWDGGATELGEEDSFIRHPDLHDAAAAALHKDHMHLQAGQIQTGKGVSKLSPVKKPATSPASSSPEMTGSDKAIVAVAVGTLLAGTAALLLNSRPLGSTATT